MRFVNRPMPEAIAMGGMCSGGIAPGSDAQLNGAVRRELSPPNPLHRAGSASCGVEVSRQLPKELAAA